MDNNNQQHNNLLLAVMLSILIVMGFQYFYVKPNHQAAQQAEMQKTDQQAKAVAAEAQPVVLRPRAEVLKDDTRIPINTPELRGSVDLKGGRIDDLQLTTYRETVDPGSPPVTLLSPAGSTAPELAYYAEASWLADNTLTPVPNDKTVWKAEGKELTPKTPLKLSWDNGQGLVFERTIAVDDQYMFTLTDHVRNTGTMPVTLYPFGLVARQGNPFSEAAAGPPDANGMVAVRTPSSIMHEGPLGVLNGTLEEHSYKDLMSEGKRSGDSGGGWLGITDKYWLVAMIVPGTEKLTASFAYSSTGQPSTDLGYFQADFRGAPVTVAPGSSADHQVLLFAGAKRQTLLEHYRDADNVPLFDRAIDFGRFYLLTIPFLRFLNFLSATMGSYAFAILVFTVLLKLVTLPLSLKSNHSMSRMKILQPEMKRLQERYKDDKVKQSQEMMDLYKREGISPLSGCVPTLIQIPIFFALYKVLYIGIEMRQAPFYGWIHDLSMPDPTSIFNLFGLIPSLPLVLHLNLLLFTVDASIGAWPIMMGLSMFLQQKMSPQPPDKSQAQIFMFLPIMFAYMLRSMPAGLVIYWTWSNLLSILQQAYIMRKDAQRKAAA